ncbi:MAG: HPr family phosphocarrier protein, partial [Planctomycetota bacterium]
MRPADLLVRMVSSFDSNVQLVKDGYAADCDSIMSLLTLGAENGAQLTLKAEGKDAEDAVEKIAAWFESGFGGLLGVCRVSNHLRRPPRAPAN